MYCTALNSALCLRHLQYVWPTLLQIREKALLWEGVEREKTKLPSDWPCPACLFAACLVSAPSAVIQYFYEFHPTLKKIIPNQTQKL